MLGEELWVMYVGQRTGTRAQPQIRTKEKTNKKKINITKQDIRSFLGAHKAKEESCHSEASLAATCHT